MYFDTLANAVGCDSIIQLDVTINYSSNEVISASSCFEYTAPSGMTLYNSGTYDDTISNMAGCDSILTINLTIDTANTEVSVAPTGNILTAEAAGAGYQWIHCDSILISGETDQTFTANSNGNYAVEITQNGCVDTSACYSIFIVGIIHNEIGAELLLYPNPTDGNFSLDLGSIQTAVTITIMDINSRLILSNSYKDRQLLSLKLEEPAGVYMVIVESGENKAVIRLVKE